MAEGHVWNVLEGLTGAQKLRAVRQKPEGPGGGREDCQRGAWQTGQLQQASGAYLLTVLEAKSPRARCQQGWLPLRPLPSLQMATFLLCPQMLFLSLSAVSSPLFEGRRLPFVVMTLFITLSPHTPTV